MPHIQTGAQSRPIEQAQHITDDVRVVFPHVFQREHVTPGPRLFRQRPPELDLALGPAVAVFRRADHRDKVRVKNERTRLQFIRNDQHLLNTFPYRIVDQRVQTTARQIHKRAMQCNLTGYTAQLFLVRV